MSFKDVNVKHSKIFSDVLIFQPSVNFDNRGSIFTTFNKELYAAHLPDELEFMHDKFAESQHNVLRGLHGDNKTWKLVTCISGSIYQVVADMRPESPTYQKWDSWVINDDNKLQILVPPNFVNGYYVLSDKAVFHYKLAYAGDYIDAEEQKVVKWDDPKLSIDWPCTDPILQKRDQ
jgi:dTDP-4-dehydrorhamnose 3,5-epimerase